MNIKQVLKDESTIDSVKNVLRLAKELRKENALPDWIKNIEL